MCALADAIIPALPRATHAVRTVTGIRATLTVVAIVVLAWQGPCSAAMSHNIKSLGQTFRLTDKSLLLTIKIRLNLSKKRSVSLHEIKIENGN